jgi:hypothetical protein
MADEGGYDYMPDYIAWYDLPLPDGTAFGMTNPLEFVINLSQPIEIIGGNFSFDFAIGGIDPNNHSSSDFSSTVSLDDDDTTIVGPIVAPLYQTVSGRWVIDPPDVVVAPFAHPIDSIDIVVNDFGPPADPNVFTFLVDHVPDATSSGLLLLLALALCFGCFLRPGKPHIG